MLELNYLGLHLVQRRAKSVGFRLRQAAGGELGDVEELGWGSLGGEGGERVAEHAFAEGACGGDGRGAGGDQFAGAGLGDAVATLFAEEG